MKTRIVIPAALIAMLTFSSCAGGQPPSLDRTPTSSSGSDAVSEANTDEDSPEPLPDAVEADLLVAEIPERCAGVGGQTLVDGQWKEGENSAILAEHSPVFLDANGDGGSDAVGILTCSQGERTEQLIVVAASGGQLVEAFSLEEPASGLKGVEITLLESVDDAVKVTGIDEVGDTVSATIGFNADGKAQIEQSNKFDDALFKMDGFGPVRLDMTGEELTELGWGEATAVGGCELVTASPLVKDLGIQFETSGKSPGTLQHLWTTDPSVATERGATVGMALDKLTAAYGDRLDEGDEKYPLYYEVNDSTMAFTVEDDKVSRIDLFAAPFEEATEWRASCER